MSRIVAIVIFYVCNMLYGERERERERERQRTKNVANQPKVKILYSYISYVIHTSLIQFISFANFNCVRAVDVNKFGSNKLHESNKLAALVCFQ